MNVDFSDEAVEYGRTALRAIEAAGGDELVQRAEVAPARREELVVPVLAELGAWDLAPRRDPDEAEAAAALCRSAGYWGLAYPVAERLSRPGDGAGGGLLVVADHRPAAAIEHTTVDWIATTLAGRRSRAGATDGAASPRYHAFVAPLDLDPLDERGQADVALALALPCWTLLGMLDRAVELTSAYVQARQQFGQPLASFQNVQFQLTEAEVERTGVEQLAKYALWATLADPEHALGDALALRVAAIDAADVIFRVAHQLHGAIGFCDETTLSWLSRYSQPLRRLPWGGSATQSHLSAWVDREGFSGLFDGQSDVFLTR